MSSLQVRFSIILFLYGINYVYSLTVGELNIYPFNYFAAGAVGVLTVFALPLLSRDKIVTDVQVIQTVWVGVHAIGYCIYMFGLDPDVYDDFQIFLNLFQILWILWARNDSEDRCLHIDGFDGIRDADNDMYRFNLKG